jgi:hypothetical protein
MATSIAWTDSIGAATLTNGRPVPADRFSGWTPDWVPIRAAATLLGPQEEESFEFADIHIARFELQNIPDTEHDLCLRLKRHLMRNGSVTINTGDDAARTYTAKRRPGSDVTLRPFNIQRRLFAMGFEMKNTAAADMICEY